MAVVLGVGYALKIHEHRLKIDENRRKSWKIDDFLTSHFGAAGLKKIVVLSLNLCVLVRRASAGCSPMTRSSRPLLTAKMRNRHTQHSAQTQKDGRGYRQNLGGRCLRAAVFLLSTFFRFPQNRPARGDRTEARTMREYFSGSDLIADRDFRIVEPL